MVYDNFEKMHITFFVYNEGNLDHEMLYTHEDQVDWTINEWKMLFRKKITYDHDKRYKQNASVPGKKLFETKHANFLLIFTRCR